MDKITAVFIVSLADLGDHGLTTVLENNFSRAAREKISCFPLRGGIDYSKLSVMHRLMMWWFKKIHLARVEEDKRNE